MENIFLWLANHYLLFTLSLVPILYLYFTRNHDYWSKRGIKGPKPLPLFGNMLDILFASPGALEYERCKKYGRVYGIFDRQKPKLVIGEPELIKFVTVKEFQNFVNRRTLPDNHKIQSNFLLHLRGQKWKRMRSMMSPTFTTGKIKRMFELMSPCVDAAIENIEKAVNKKCDVDLKHLFGTLSMDVIATCAFATKIDSHNDPNNPFTRNAFEFFTAKKWRLLILLLIPRFVLDFLEFALIPSKAYKFFEHVVKHLLTVRKDNPRNDFLQLLIDAEEKKSSLLNEIKDINAAVLNDENNDETEKNVKLLSDYESNEKKLSEIDIVANSTLFFIAGYETTASTLTLSCYALAMHQVVQEKVYDEILKHEKKYGKLNFDTMNELVYLHAFISETLRYFSPIAIFEREATGETELPGIGIKVKKGFSVRIPVYAIHHDPEFYPEPEQFRPERFLPENVDHIKPYTFLPFGSGPRNCIGMRFALTEVKSSLYKIILKYRFLKSTKNETKLSIISNSIVGVRTTSKPVWVTAEER